MTPPDWLHQVEQGTASLAGQADLVYQQLWNDHRLTYGDDSFDPVGVDPISACLVTTAVKRRTSLLLVLPDRSPGRPALLFATALATYGVDVVFAGRPAGVVLYVGSHVGIREQLASTWIRDCRLDTVFQQVRAAGSAGMRIQDGEGAHLPAVVTVHAPADVAPLLDQLRPAWVALDGGNELELKWLRNLLQQTARREIPVIGWCQNPLSRTVETFAEAGGSVFRWPPASWLSSTHNGRPLSSSVAAVQLEGDGAAAVENPLRQAYRALAATLGMDGGGRLRHDALRVAWQQFRLLEALPIPIEIYEAEANAYWGLRTIKRGREAVEAFVAALRVSEPGVAALLDEAATSMEQAASELKRMEVPHWQVLADLSVTDAPDGGARLLLFPNQGQRQLFEFSLLACYGVSTADLADLRIAALSAQDFYGRGRQPWIGDPEREEVPRAIQLSPDPSTWEVLVPGLPTERLLARLEPGLHAGVRLRFLVYPYQVPALTRRLAQCMQGLTVSGDRLSASLIALGAKPGRVISDAPPLLDVGEHTVYEVAGGKMGGVAAVRRPPSKPPTDPVAEAAWLLEEALEEEDQPVIVLDEENDGGRSGKPLFVGSAFEVSFEGGWSGLFSPHDMLNVLIQGDRELHPRNVQALRPGDHVLYIHGQRRQSLYELIIRRVHGHPAFALHVSLVARWQTDAAEAFQRWRKRGTTLRGVADLLAALRERGSTITTTQTVVNWLTGCCLCPDDPEDLRRLAEVLDLTFVNQHYPKIVRAAKRLQGKHRSWGKRLSYWLEHGAHAADQGELFDEELGLSFGDLQGSLLRLRVRNVQAVPGPIYCERLGKLEQRGATSA